MMHALSVTLIAFFAFFEVVKCGGNIHGDLWSRRHTDVARAQQNTALQKRFDDCKFTFYAAGLGACGENNSPNDFTVALNEAQFGDGAYCFQTITITVNGKSTQAQITDNCPSCPYGGLDLTSGLFNFFGSESVGVLIGSWVFGVPSTSTSTTPTWTTPTSTSTYQPPPSSSSSVTNYTTSNSTSVPTSTSTPTPTSTSKPMPTSTQSSASISATPTTLSQETGNIAGLFQIIIQFGSILRVAHHS